MLENGNRGLDHGWGNVMFVAGKGVNGGYYVNQQQGWKPLGDDLESDLHVTTDYRNVLAEIVASRFGAVVGGVPGLHPSRGSCKRLRGWARYGLRRRSGRVDGAVAGSSRVPGPGRVIPAPDRS